jgi:hypothetical protein
MRRSFRFLGGVVGWCGMSALVVAGCGSGSPAMRMGSLIPRTPAEQGRCQVAASQSTPLVTEWPASEKANLEVLLRAGAVAVAFSGCSMRVLPECRVRGAYSWSRTTPATDSLEINDADELYAKLPLGAPSLEGELKRSGKLSVQTVVSGQLRLEGAAMGDIPKEGPCAQATHIVSALSLGAFALKAGGTRNAGATVGVASIGEAGYKNERSADLLRAAGDFDSCKTSTAEGPSVNCASPIQAFLTPIPGRTEEEGPPGTAKVDFVSSNPASRWDVYADDRVICTTPCTQWVSAERPVMLRAREEAFMAAPDKVSVPNLLAHGGGHLQLEAHPTARGQLAAGITFTTFSGMAVLTGVTLTSLGCLADKGDGLCTGGVITLAIGAPLLAGSIWMILDAMPKAEVHSHDAGTLYVKAPARRTIWGPGFVAGTF